MMFTCDSHGDCVVVYGNRSCPVCDVIEDFQDSIKELEDRLDDANDEYTTDKGN